MAALPEFVVHTPPICDPQSPPPYRFEDVGIQLFVVPAAGARLQAVCDRFLNNVAERHGSPFRIDPLTGLGRGVVNAQVLRYPRIYSEAPGHEELGYGSQNELFFSIPVVLKFHGFPRAVGLFTPFLCVDNSNSLITGREVVGYAKVGGHFTLPPDIGDSVGTTVKTLTTKGLSRNQRVEDRDIFETVAADETLMLPADSYLHDAVTDGDVAGTVKPEVAKPLWPFGPVAELFEADGHFPVDKRTLALLQGSAGVGMRSFTLKQFRDAEYPDRACYQAIVSGAADIIDFQAGGVLSKATIKVKKYTSIDIIDQLGLDSNGDTVNALYGLWYRAGFRLGQLDNLLVSQGAGDGRHGLPDCVSMMADGTRAVFGLYQNAALAWLRMVEGCLQAAVPRSR